ncbi:DUF1501 domain-containing protein [Novipirellula artificiosorum]|uniref:DUF1501 domain-containing protein n=1 Tax=Novipirellula artificiosorum TaxID=2528016 RepID=A0A5C6DKP5_9BACT|nr:DUF1501 domain-containing protein [Novipirellula artificiosorum]TWU37162.1 hypothetical protein Poly41_32890 [Novipirellula artificiosorum]
MSNPRRHFLKSLVGTSAAISFSSVLPSLLNRSVLAASETEPTKDTVLVVVQLSGGNDGLNTLVPYADDVYARSRTTLRLKENEVHKIGDDLGFHPDIPQFQRLLDDGDLMVVQGVGHSNSNRDHDAAMRDWHTARPGDSTCQTGWLGRAIDEANHPEDPSVCGVLVSPIPMPLALGTKRVVIPSVVSADQWRLRGPNADHDERMETRMPSTVISNNPLGDLVRTASLAAYATDAKIESVLRQGNPSHNYPSFSLAKQLRTISELIRAEVGVRIFFAELGGGGIGGFDNHANQKDNHAALLRELSASVAAFVDDLKQQRLLDRVLLMSFSEFGRTVSENGRRGTGHGAAAPVFLAGGSLNGGLFGERPRLSDLDQDAPRHQIDYRQVYATALDRWLGFPSESSLAAKYKPLDIFAS